MRRWFWWFGRDVYTAKRDQGMCPNTTSRRHLTARSIDSKFCLACRMDLPVSTNTPKP